jgi:ribosome-associated protein
MPENVRDAILMCQTITNHEGRRRQLQYVGKMMRTLDEEEVAVIQRTIESWKGASKAETASLHALERRRDKLLADDKALTQLLEEHPQLDVQHLRTLIRNARKEQAENKPPKAYREIFQILKDLAKPAKAAPPEEDEGEDATMSPTNKVDELANELVIGLVSVSDRASGGVYEDKGIPALQEWLGKALTTPFRVETRLIPDDRDDIESTLIELVDEARCHLVLTTGGTGPARRDVTPEATLAIGTQGDAGLRRADAPGQPALRADRDPVAPGRRDPRDARSRGPGHEPAGPAEIDQGNPRRA